MSELEKSYFDETINFNKITKFLHQRKYLLTEQVIKKETKQDKINILDIGCGSATMFQYLNQLNLDFTYTGIEPQEDLYKVAEKNFSKNSNFSIIKDPIEKDFGILENFNFILAMDSLEHIPLDIRNEIIDNVSKSNCKKFLINVPNEIGPIVTIKNFGSFIMRYPRYKEYSFSENFFASFYNVSKFPHHIDAHKGFDWRHLEYSLRFYFKNKVKIKTLFPFLPKTFSPSIFLVCK